MSSRPLPPCHPDRSEAKWRDLGTALHRTRCERSLDYARDDKRGRRREGSPIHVIPTTAPTHVIPTGAKRSGGILALPCTKPGAKDPSTTLGMTNGGRMASVGDGAKIPHPCHPDYSTPPMSSRPLPPMSSRPERSEVEGSSHSQRCTHLPRSLGCAPMSSRPEHPTSSPPLPPMSSRPKRSGVEGSWHCLAPNQVRKIPRLRSGCHRFLGRLRSG